MKNQNGTKEKLCVQLTSKKNNTMFPYIFQNKHDYNMIKPAIISNIYHPNSRVELPSLPDSWSECTNRNKDPKLGTEWTHKITHSWLYNGCLFPKYGRWSWLYIYIYSNRLALRIFIIVFFSNRSISYMIFLGENNILSAYPQTMHIEYKPCKDVLSWSWIKPSCCMAMSALFTLDFTDQRFAWRVLRFW